jgi:hypothetical protein
VRQALLAALLAIASTFAVIAPRASAQTNCARPNVPASIVRTVLPDIPPMAQQQGISGTVQVRVSLDEQSHVTGTSIMSSPSVILNAPALVAARQSVYQTEIRDCKPIAASYINAIEFNVEPSSPQIVQAPRDPAIVINAQGAVSRPADVAYLNASLIASDDVETTATAKNEAMFAALREKLRALGIGADKIQSTYTVSYVRPLTVPAPASSPQPQTIATPTPRYGYVGARLVVVTLDRPDDAGKVAETMTAAGASFVSPPQYGLRDREAAYTEALATAMKSARERAQTVAAAGNLRLGAVQRVENNDRGPAYPYSVWPPQYSRTRIIVVTASVTVTYLIQR